MVRDSRLVLFTCLLLLTLILAPTFKFPPVQAVTTTVSVVPSFIAVGLGQDFNIDIAVSGVLDLFGWEFALTWDPLLLDATSVVEGPFLEASGKSTFFTYVINSTDGRMVVDCTLLGETPGVTGSGLMSTLTFHTKDYGESPLPLHNVTLINSFEQIIPCLTTNGYWQGTSPHDVSVTDISFLPSAVVQTGDIMINTTVKNQGTLAEVLNVSVYVDSMQVAMQSVSLDPDFSAVVPFIWNTTGFSKGDYLIMASIAPVEGELDLVDNNRTADTLAAVLVAGHDIAIVSSELSKSVVGYGYNVSLTVRVGNYGIYAETFYVAAFAYETLIGKHVLTLDSAEKADLLFVIDTSSMAKGNYSVSAIADIVLGETFTSDNTGNGGWFFVTIPGDVNGDGAVNIIDAIILSNAFYSVPGYTSWNPNADINGNNAVNILDAIILSNYFLQHYP